MRLKNFQDSFVRGLKNFQELWKIIQDPRNKKNIKKKTQDWLIPFFNLHGESFSFKGIEVL